MASRAPLARWTAFNGVGAIGVAVQLAALAFLVRGLGMPLIPATVVAVETAVVHNFLWHNYWTWRDRPSESLRTTMTRFVRFQLLNGVISLVGNVAITAMLASWLGIDAVVASAVAIAVCSTLNFAASELFVFAGRGAGAALVMLLVIPSQVNAGPGQAALDAWRAYEAAVDARYASQAAGGPFFVQDSQPAAGGWRAAIGRSEITTVALAPPPAGDGRIHHWAGAVFVPGVTVTQVIDRLLKHAGRESQFYEDVIDSRLIARDGDRVNVFMRLRRTSIITATFNTEHVVDYRRIGSGRGSSRSVATRIAELADTGSPDERERAAEDERGFLWKLNAYWRFEASAGGVIVECESLSLSRGVPLLLRTVANPMIDRVARESLERTLAGLRAFLLPAAGRETAGQARTPARR
jgi:putative flippase GtrA